MKATLRERRAWIRLGWELAALEKFAIDIEDSKEYQELMGAEVMRELFKVYEAVNRVRQEADSRSSRRVAFVGPDLFYGSGLEPAREMAEGFREKLAVEAHARGDRLYNLTEVGQ